MRPQHITEEQLEAMRTRVKRGVDARHTTAGTSGSSFEAAIQQTVSRRGESAASPYRSKLERAWANYLHGLWMLGAITQVWYEPLNLRLPGKKNFYKPDFLVLAGDGLTFYEIKGRNKSDARSLVKIKTAAGLTPWAKFVLVKRIGGQWEERTIT